MTSQVFFCFYRGSDNCPSFFLPLSEAVKKLVDLKRRLLWNYSGALHLIDGFGDLSLFLQVVAMDGKRAQTVGSPCFDMYCVDNVLPIFVPCFGLLRHCKTVLYILHHLCRYFALVAI